MLKKNKLTNKCEFLLQMDMFVIKNIKLLI